MRQTRVNREERRLAFSATVMFWAVCGFVAIALGTMFGRAVALTIDWFNHH